MKQYVKFLLKKYIPYFAISFSIILAIFLVNIGTNGDYYSYHYDIENNVRYLTHYPTSNILVYIIPLIILSLVAPFFANSYRYSIKSTDVFYQTGKGNKAIRYTNNLVIWISTLAVYTIGVILAVIILLIRQLPNAGKEIVIGNTTYSYIAYNYGYFILAYLSGVIVASINYFISYYLITRANTLGNSIMTLIFGQAILGIIFMTPFWYISYIRTIFSYNDFINEGLLGGTRTLCFIGPISFIYNIFEKPIVNEGFKEINLAYGMNVFAFVLTIICLVIYFVIGGLSIYLFIKEKESSGELAGKHLGRDKAQMFIFHLAIGLGAFWSGTLRGIVNSALFFVVILISISNLIIFAALYYVLFGVVKKNFKLNKKELITYLSVVAVDIISSIVSSILTGVVMANTNI